MNVYGVCGANSSVGRSRCVSNLYLRLSNIGRVDLNAESYSNIYKQSLTLYYVSITGLAPTQPTSYLAERLEINLLKE